MHMTHPRPLDGSPTLLKRHHRSARPAVASALTMVLLVQLVLASVVVMPAEAHALTVGEASAESKRIAAGDAHSLAVASDGTVQAWGYNDDGQLNVPAGLTGVVAVAAGESHSLALKADGTVVAWGGGYSGVSYVPAGVNNAVAIAAGGEHSLVLRADGTVVAAGRNGHFQCDVPAGLTGVTAIAGGGIHSLALKADGTVVGWGDNTWNQCTAPTGLSDVVAISAGGLHSLALKADGTVVAWGRSSEQQCSVPAGLSDVVAISAGLNHSLALKADGTVVGWGGMTEDGNVDGASVIPAGLSSVTAVGAGGRHSLVRAAGGLRGWGRNTAGQCFGAISVKPPSHTPGIPVNTTFEIDFNTNPVAGPAYAQISLKDTNGASVAIDKTLSGARLSVKPKTALKSDARYLLIMPEGALKDGWGTLAPAYGFEYTTPDTLPPVVLSLSPADGVTGAALDQVVTLVFNEDLVPGPAYAGITLKDGGGADVPCTVTIGGARNRVLTITPTVGLNRSSAYRVTVPADAVHDVAGNAYGGRTINFSTDLLYQRIAGVNRITTAIGISKDTFASAETVIIATALNFPDALAAAPLAHAYGGPILLVPTTGLPADVKTEIARLGAKNAIIVGGTPAVSAAVERDLKGLKLSVKRVYGADRYATAAAIANELKTARKVGGFDRVYVATGESFPDALSVGGIAAADGAPILLVKKGSLPVPTAQAIKSFSVKKTVVLGGASAVSEGVKRQLPNAMRLEGPNRFATGVAIAEYGISEHIVSGSGVYVSTGLNYPDALAVGPASARTKRLTILVSSSGPLPAPVASFVTAHAGSITSIKIVGGTTAVTDGVAQSIKQMVE